jgi:hypothetical protein
MFISTHLLSINILNLISTLSIAGSNTYAHRTLDYLRPGQSCSSIIGLTKSPKVLPLPAMLIAGTRRVEALRAASRRDGCGIVSERIVTITRALDIFGASVSHLT